MVFTIGREYERNLEGIALMIKAGKLTGIPSQKTSGVSCYFCLERINGKSEVIIMDDVITREVYHLHSRCYGAALKGEMDKIRSNR